MKGLEKRSFIVIYWGKDGDDIYDKKLRDELLQKYEQIIGNENLKITLAIIQIGSDESSNTYINNKVKYAEKIGIQTKVIKLSKTITEKECFQVIDEMNKNQEITGIIIQSPVPQNLNFQNLVRRISPLKDVDGLSEKNILALRDNHEKILPATVAGILYLLEYYKISISSKNIVVIGRSDIVGKPLAEALLNRDATVTLCHFKTKDFRNFTKQADIVISAVGIPNLITKEDLKKDAIVVDVGITPLDGKLLGDFHKNVGEVASYLTPVPGGVGPMTIAMVMNNLIELKRGQ